MTYPDPKVSETVSAQFVPLKVMVPENPHLCDQFKVQWTPTLLVLDADRREHHRWVGYLPPADFLAQLALARAKAEFGQGHFKEAADLFARVVSEHPQSEVAPEAQYYCGVSRYKATGEPAQLKAAWQALTEKYPTSDWTKKASFMFA